MHTRTLILAASTLAALSVAGSSVVAAPITSSGGTPQIVMLDPGSNAPAKAAAEERRGNDVADVYSTVIDGFAATLDATDIARLKADPSVVSVEPDARVSINAAPANNAFASATGITGISGNINGTTSQATRETGEPQPISAWGTKGKSIWYSWTAPVSGSVTITTAGSSFDTLLAAYTGSSLTTLTVLGANDDVGGGNLTSTITFAVTEGTSYRIVVDGYGNASGSTRLNWALTPAGPPVNDALASATVITGSAGSRSISTVNATREAGEPNHGGNSGGRSVWFAWTAPANGPATFSTSASSFTTLLGGYSGPSSSPTFGALIAKSQGLTTVGFTAVTGTTYYVAVDGLGGASGSTTLGWTLTAPIATRPDPPSAVTVSTFGTTATVVATPPANDGGSAITAYAATCTSSDGGTTRTGTSSTGPSIQVTTLSTGRSYTCRATATNSAGTSESSVLSSAFTVASVPLAPTSVTAIGRDAGATVSWTASSSDGRSAITAYTVTSSGRLGSSPRTCTTPDAITVTCAVSGLTNGDAYTFTVRATNAVGQSAASLPSASVTPAATIVPLPSEPAPAPGATTPAAPSEPSAITGPGLPQSRLTDDWGLDRIDQRGVPLDGRFSVPLDGTGVTAYVVDTGVATGHGEFTNRVIDGVNLVGDGNGTEDCNGHGTHVAGTIAGATHGVASMARISPVRVLGCSGDGSVSDVIAGLDWIVRTHAAGVPAVANMSMGTPSSAALNAAVDRTVADGVSVAVAAGNENANACNMSPASNAQAITVGAVDDADTRADFSNYGSCVTVFAPGVDIESAWFTGSKDTEVLSGTSMAAPHAAGVAALLLSGTPNATPAQVKLGIADSATAGALSGIGLGSPNLLLYANVSSVPQAIASGNTQSPNAVVAKPKAPVLKSLRRNAKGRLVVRLTAPKGVIVRVYAGSRIVKVAKAPATGKVFSIVVAKTVKKGARITVRALNSAGLSKPTRTLSAP